MLSLSPSLAALLPASCCYVAVAVVVFAMTVLLLLKVTMECRWMMLISLSLMGFANLLNRVLPIL